MTYAPHYRFDDLDRLVMLREYTATSIRQILITDDRIMRTSLELIERSHALLTRLEGADVPLETGKRHG